MAVRSVIMIARSYSMMNWERFSKSSKEQQSLFTYALTYLFRGQHLFAAHSIPRRDGNGCICLHFPALISLWSSMSRENAQKYVNMQVSSGEINRLTPSIPESQDSSYYSIHRRNSLSSHRLPFMGSSEIRITSSSSSYVFGIKNMIFSISFYYKLAIIYIWLYLIALLLYIIQTLKKSISLLLKQLLMLVQLALQMTISMTLNMIFSDSSSILLFQNSSRLKRLNGNKNTKTLCTLY